MPTDGNAIVYCEGAFATSDGKTAHGLVRHTTRYRVVSVVDSSHVGSDAGAVLDGRPRGIPVHSTVGEAADAARAADHPATHFVVGLAPVGGRLRPRDRGAVMEAIRLGLHVDSALHDFLSEDERIASLAVAHGVRIRDIRRPAPPGRRHFFSGKIDEVTSLRVAILGTDSCVGKRTTATILTDVLPSAGFRAELIGTGQTAWMQGVAYGIILDSLVNDFVAGEIEHAVWSAWRHAEPDVILIEGQGSLMNPAFPGGFEILAAARPHAVILQHAPARREYEGFPGRPIHPLPQQIQAIELISGKPVIAVTVSSENLDAAETAAACDRITQTTGLPAADVLREGPGRIVAALTAHLERCRPQGKVGA